MTLGGTPYTADTLTFNAFPSGTLAAVIAQPPPAAALTSESCGAVTVVITSPVSPR